MSQIRRLDHIAIAVRDSTAALAYFSDQLGLPVVSTEVLESPAVRLTYLDAGNAFIQLVEPLDQESAVAESIARDGEGIHHICFGVDDVAAEAARLAGPGSPPIVLGQGRGRASAFVPGEQRHGVFIECTEFKASDPGPYVGQNAPAPAPGASLQDKGQP